ncbi:contact-dependent growth inhibition system immunity protein [Bacillus alkalicellulosilyticus]|uniref:contact-dependent growth inhibition system immunity protein n=1 Tax=Alkalihalobacterium alkalicellulosilyticum TaxID=1912214 RepID=UPI001482B25B
MRKCLELRNKKLSDLNAEDLRIMIGQNISLNYLIPIALEVLANNPFAEANLYIGDLLEQVLRVETDPLRISRIWFSK